MDTILYENDKTFVISRLKEGKFDVIDSCNEVFESEFFRFIKAKDYLKELAETYPTPRKKEEVPLWLYVASNISMRLHGAQSYYQFPFVVRCGGMLTGLGPEVGQKGVNPQGEMSVGCAGFNHKNSYGRETPCDQDFLRKLSHDTDARKLEAWFNHDVARLWKKHKVFDKEGLFIGDGSYLFVPDNDKYEGSAKLLFDENNHPVDSQNVSQEAIRKGSYQWRRCYKMVSLLHTNHAQDFFLVCAVKVVPGNDHECPLFYDLLETFLTATGPGVVKRVILDRGFIDGERISSLKRDHAIDVLLPVRRNMDIYQDAL